MSCRIAAAAMESGDGEAYLSKLHVRPLPHHLASPPTARCSTTRRRTPRQMENHARARGGPSRRWQTGTGAARAATARRCWKRPSTSARRLHGRHRAAPVRQPRHDGRAAARSMFPAHPARSSPWPLMLSSLLASRRVPAASSRPLNALDLEHPLENDAYEELSPLLRRLEHQRQSDRRSAALDLRRRDRGV